MEKKSPFILLLACVAFIVTLAFLANNESKKPKGISEIQDFIGGGPVFDNEQLKDIIER